MEHGFWIERWDRGEIGFHQNEINPYLVQFWPVLGDAEAPTVFVPLCGKSRDMVWLRERGHTVWGVELSPLAVKQFFEEQGLVPRRRIVRDMSLYSAGSYNIYQGDFFRLRPVHLPPLHSVYDRASLVALPPALRARYVHHLRCLIGARSRVLLVSIDYPAHQMQGPPFSVNDPEIHRLFEDAFDVRGLSVRNVLDENPRFRERGLTHLEDRVYLLTRK